MIYIREPFTSPLTEAFIYFSHHSGHTPKLKLPVSHYQVRAAICIINSHIITHQPKVTSPFHKSTGYQEINPVNTGEDLPLAFVCLLINQIMPIHKIHENVFGGCS